MRWRIGRQPCVDALEPRAHPAAVPLTISSIARSYGSELRITGSGGNDSISVNRKGTGILITTVAGFSRLWTGSPSLISIDGGAGNDKISVDSAITLNCKLIGGSGNDTLIGGGGIDSIYGGAGVDLLSGAGGDDLLVSFGDNTSDKLIGGDGNDSFWADTSGSEKINDASTIELAGGAVHRVSRFDDSVPTVSAGGESAGATMDDPYLVNSAIGYADFSDRPLFSKYGPRVNDVTQGNLGDCYLLASLASVAKADPNVLRQTIVDLGDGTYGVQFHSAFGTRFVHVDGSLPVNRAGKIAFAQLGLQQSTWVALYEKAYALDAGGNPSYSSIDSGYMGDVYASLGMEYQSRFTATDGTTLLNQLKSDLASGQAVTYATGAKIDASAPLVANHAYLVDSVTVSNGQLSLRLKNPWGIDGAGNDGSNDGFVSITANQAYDAFYFACAATV